MYRAILWLFLMGILAVVPTIELAADVTGVTGGGQPHTNMQPSLGLNAFIPLQGIYPSQESVSSEMFLGGIRMFAGNFAPGGSAFAEGQLLPISQNTALFSLLGTTYGGDGQTTFALPDLRSRAAIGKATGLGLSNRPLGAVTGMEVVTLTEANLPAHIHSLPPSANITGSTGGNQPFTNMQPSLALNYIIATQGIYPSPDSRTAGQTFLGEVIPFAGDFAPGGWAFADGQLLSISQNTALFSLLGTTYGGDGQTTFALPDLRGRTPISAGTGPGLPSRLLGETIGVEDVTLAEAQLPNHVHTLPPSADVTGSTGGNQPFTNMQPSLALNYVIATDGIYPPRDGFVPGVTLLGEVSIFAGNFAPGGWAFADGQLLPISQNTALFSLLGTTYGGDGQTTFALPDLRGRTLLHAGTGTTTLGESFGIDQVTLTMAQMPSHVHDFPIPEPSTLALAFTILAGIARLRYRGVAC